MPIDSILVSAAVVTVFVVFAGVLAWGQVQSPQRLEEAPRKRRSF